MQKIKPLSLPTLTLTLTLLHCSCSTPTAPNILWITCEDISPAWGCYGDEQATTPNIDQLAENGFVFRQAFSNAPICSPARSTLITGMYANSLGTQNLRSEIPVPDDLKILPQLLKEKGYFTSNNAKTDYNFSAEGRWDELSNKAHWRNRNQDQPFFSVFNFGITHEGHANSNNLKDTESLDKLHDPAKMQLPPYYPDTDEFRSVIAHQYDLITVFDQEVGKLVQQLKEDGLYDNTIIFVFSDHGFGLPRYKRWLYNTGLQVPFVLHVPEKYKDKVSNLTSPDVKQMVGFVDFAPTVLNLAGIDAPEKMEGKNFLGAGETPTDYIYGYRDRADDAYDMARSIYDGRYIYIRHFMPHIPYIQNAMIFNENKRSYIELRRLKIQNNLSDETLQMYQPKAVEELYDLQNDPFELTNIVDDPAQKEKVAELKEKLKEYIIKYHDTGLMNEGNMMMRSGDQSIYDYTHNNSDYDAEKLYNAASMVGTVESPEKIKEMLTNSDPDVRFWAMQTILSFKGDKSLLKTDLIDRLNDEFLTNQALAAEILINEFDYMNALETLKSALYTDNQPVLLQVAISVRKIGAKAKPLLSVIQNDIYPKIAGDVWGKYKNWYYPMFIGMAFDQTLENCGIEVAMKK